MERGPNMNNKVLKYYHGRSVNYFPEINHWSYAQSNSCHSYYWSQRVCGSWWDILGKNTNNSQGRQNSHRNNVQCAHLAFIDKEIEKVKDILSVVEIVVRCWTFLDWQRFLSRVKLKDIKNFSWFHQKYSKKTLVVLF